MVSHGKVRRAAHQELNLADGQFELGDLLSPTEIYDLMLLARARIIGVFRHAEQTVRRKPTKEEHDWNQAVGLVRPYHRLIDTDNYIVGVEPKQSELARFIQRSLRNHFITWGDLRNYTGLKWALEVSDKIAKRFMIKLEYKIICLELNLMVDDGEVWYEADRGIWQIAQSVIDEHLQKRDTVRRAVKFDQRTEHGQVRQQRKARGRPAGASVSHARNSTMFPGS